MKQDIDIKRRTQSGITLIALVVTIIVLLILAAVSISTLTGENGILTNAKEARDKTREANARETVQIEVLGSYDSDGKLSTELLNTNLKRIEGLTHGGKTLDENPITSLPTEVELDGYTIEIDANGKVTIKGTSDVKPGGDETGDQNAPSIDIPSKATLSKIPGEFENEEEGIVIYIIPEDEKETVDWTADEDGNGILDVQEKYDQFVWVPVPNAVAEDMDNDGDVDTTDIDLMIAEEKYPMAIKIDETNYRGVLYDFTLADGKVVVSDKVWTSTSTSNREPAYLTDSSLADASSYNNVGITPDSLQTEFNTMVQKVASNGGFWVGRYETSNMNASSDDVKIGVVKGTTTGISNVIWYRMYQQQKNYPNKANITLTSSMIWGSQWDQIMIWMKNVQNEAQNSYYVINSIGMANYGTISGVDDGYSDTSAPAPTGCFAVKNIYDLAGNVWDWTLEAYGTDSRVVRGGFYHNADTGFTRAHFRSYYYGIPYYADSYSGSRASLY